MQSTYYIVDSFNSTLPSEGATTVAATRALKATPSQTAAPQYPSSKSKPSFGTFGRKNYRTWATTTTVQPLMRGGTVENAGENTVAEQWQSAAWDTVFVPLPRYFIDSRSAQKTVQIELCRVFDFSESEAGTELPSTLHSDLSN